MNDAELIARVQALLGGRPLEVSANDLRDAIIPMVAGRLNVVIQASPEPDLTGDP